MYPINSKSERIADGAIHAIGVTAAVAGAMTLAARTTGLASPQLSTALGIYGATLIATFLASASYHLVPWHGARPFLRRFDHAAIYLKIAGTYTPLVVLIGSGFAYIILALIWVLAVIGMVLKLFFWRRGEAPSSPALYLIMGWLSLGLVGSLWIVVPPASMLLIGLGGLLYTAGVPFCISETMRYSTAIWHSLVLLASACFFAAIWLGLAGA